MKEIGGVKCGFAGVTEGRAKCGVRIIVAGGGLHQKLEVYQ